MEITHAPCIQDALLTVGIFRNYIDDENMLRLKSLYRLAFVCFRLVYAEWKDNRAGDIFQEWTSIPSRHL